jgi:hypothetical protein
MENLSLQKQYEKLESEFYLSRRLIPVLFILSFAGILVGLIGWILSPGMLWKIPVNYYMIITTAAIVLLGFTFIGRIATGNLKLTFSKLKTYQ